MEYNDLTYDKPRVQKPEELDKETQKVLDWVGQSKHVLEVGCHTGYLSEWLQKLNCHVTGVDINNNALKVAEKYLIKTICANIESEEFWKRLEEEKFDVITFMHVLEHLANPWDVLKKSISLLKPEGEIIIALPNISNAKERFDMLFGKFEYTPMGVMDKTHLRFFNQKTARELIHQAGLEIVDYYSPWQVNPFHYFLDHLPFLWKFKNVWNPHRIPFIFKNKTNLTDVVMMFRCKLKRQ